MIINGFEKLSLVDYPGYTACTIFTGACNMRCPFCHNAVLVLDAASQPLIEEQYILDYLSKRKGILDGICITGGEPTLQPDLIDFIKKCKETGIKIKLDSNGSNPKIIRKLISANLIDYIAMDIKNCKEKYATTTNSSVDIKSIEESINLLKENFVDYEFRTTLVNKFHNIEDIESIAKWLNGSNKYYLQKFEDKGGCIEDNLTEVPIETARAMREVAKKYIKNVELRSYE